jgi:multidrug resistance efflux pump
MHPNPRRILPVVLLVIVGAVLAWYYFGGGLAAANNGPLTASGTIETTQVNVSPELGGRVRAVNVSEGDAVQAGDVLVELDAALLTAQRTQAQAALAAAQGAHAAAQAGHAAAVANYELLQAGPTAEQLAVLQAGVDQAQLGVDAAQDAYDALPEAARDTTTGQALKQQLDKALIALEAAQAQYDLVEAGARPQQLDAAQAQVDAAQAQVEATRAQAAAAQAAVDVLDVQIGKLKLAAPVSGIVLARTIEPGELASPGATLLVIGQLDDLTITVYVPEDRYGPIRLGQSATVTVDSFPNDGFVATVTHIADQAEFTPRNVQTVSGRKTTVYALRLSVSDPSGKLKPGMPADVEFGS